MRDKPLDELYFVWLYSQVGSVEDPNPTRSYWKLLKKLYVTEFLHLIANDENRAEDGKDLRHEFVEDENLIDVDEDWFNLGCSMLEMMIALSRRAAFEDEGLPMHWFWRMIENLGLEQFNDRNYFSIDHGEEIDNIINDVVWRTYKRSGAGGLFPLKHAHEDQREVELWYQLSAYLLEND